MAEIKKTGRGYQVISKVLHHQTHSRLTWRQAEKIKAKYERLEKQLEEKE